MDKLILCINNIILHIDEKAKTTEGCLQVGGILQRVYKVYLKDNASWTIKTKTSPTRGFQNDTCSTSDRGTSTLSAQDKADRLEDMLGYIASFCPSYNNDIIIQHHLPKRCMGENKRLFGGSKI